MKKKFDAQLKQEAYQLGIKYINTRFDIDAIYAKLEKQGVSNYLAKEAATNIILQRKSNSKINFSDYKKLGIYLAIFWLIGYAIAYLYTGDIYIGIMFLLFTVIPSAIIGYLMSTTKLKSL